MISIRINIWQWKHFKWCHYNKTRQAYSLWHSISIWQSDHKVLSFESIKYNFDNTTNAGLMYKITPDKWNNK